MKQNQLGERGRVGKRRGKKKRKAMCINSIISEWEGRRPDKKVRKRKMCEIFFFSGTEGERRIERRQRKGRDGRYKHRR